MREIPLGGRKYPGLVALVDDEDYEAAMTRRWHPICTNGSTLYVSSGRGRAFIYLHNFICQLHGLSASPDHANRNALDNQKRNFRLKPSASQQGANQGLRRNNTSGFKGVSWSRKSQKWEAYIMVNRHRRRLGWFDNPEDGARAYDKAAVESFGEFAALNFPDEVAA